MCVQNVFLGCPVRLRETAPHVFINIIRDPLDRLVSLYYYIRFHPEHKYPMSHARRYMVNTTASTIYIFVPIFCS